MIKVAYAAFAFLLFAGPAFAGSNPIKLNPDSKHCLATDRIASFAQGGRYGVVVVARDGTKFDVAFKAACPYHLNSHFVYNPALLGRCLSKGDTLQISTGGACIVTSVKQQPPLPNETPMQNETKAPSGND